MLKFNYVPILSHPYPRSLSLIIASFIQSWWWNLICIGSKYWKVTNQFQLQVIFTPFIHYSLLTFLNWNNICAHNKVTNVISCFTWYDISLLDAFCFCLISKSCMGNPCMMLHETMKVGTEKVHHGYNGH